MLIYASEIESMKWSNPVLKLVLDQIHRAQIEGPALLKLSTHLEARVLKVSMSSVNQLHGTLQKHQASCESREVCRVTPRKLAAVSTLSVYETQNRTARPDCKPS